MEVRDSRPFVLPGGRGLAIAATSAAVSRGLVFVAGRGLIWSSRNDTVVGAVVDPTTGAVTAVPNPLRGGGAAQLRVAAAADGGWHLVFIDTAGVREGSPGLLESVDIWYGRWDAGEWRELVRIATAYDASLDASGSSQLGVEGESLRFAFPYQPETGGRPDSRPSGFIMLRRDQGRWSADTLRVDRPAQARLAKGRGHAWHLALTYAPFRDPVVRSTSLFVTEYSDRWHEVRLVANGASEPVTTPHIVPLSDGVIASWMRVGGSGWRSEWVKLPETGALVDAADVLPHSADVMISGFNTVALHDDGLLWHGGLNGAASSVQLLMYRNGRLIDLGTLPEVENDSFTQLMVPLSPREVVLFTDRVAHSVIDGRPTIDVSDPNPVATMMSRITISCPEGG